ncbi:response regulator [Terrimonas pollutisoli]|uniref:response regulator n=1 Tax=Terrimonas pollutisoli TaxID=3034147 RepID=UPI0023EC9867|nr:response regulator [Terrimonas sp. H1YJ31]
MNEIKILLVEDNEGDIILTREALLEGKIKNEVSVAMDGQEALDMLQSATSLPDLVLLDINLPKMNGLEVLAAIKKDDRLKMIPVIMLSTSASERDIKDSYSNHASCFITKPVDYNRFMEVVRTIEDFWITVVRLPNNIK